MKAKYPHITNVLSTIYSIQSGLDWEQAFVAFDAMLEKGDWGNRLRAEIGRAFADPTVNWKEQLFNEVYEVYEAESETDAREFAGSILWSRTFLDRSLPKVD